MEGKDTINEFVSKDNDDVHQENDYGHSSLLPKMELDIYDCENKILPFSIEVKSEGMSQNVDCTTAEVKYEVEDHIKSSDHVNLTLSEQNVNVYASDLEQSSLNVKVEPSVLEEDVKLPLTIQDGTNEIETKQVDDVKIKEEIEDKTELLTDEFHVPHMINESHISDYYKQLQVPGKSANTCKKKTKKWYPCPMCRKKFRSGSTRKNHFTHHCRKCRGICPVCGKLLVKYEEFVHHYSQHILNKFYRCEMCFKNFYVKRLFHIHQQLHNFHINSSASDGIKDEVDIIYNDLEFKKEINNETETSFIKPTLHLTIHTEERNFNCDICLKQFASETRLTRHYRVHTGEKPFKCEICLKLFAQRTSLSNHLLAHSGEQPFKCHICQKQFAQRSFLTSHLKIHTGEKSFKCDICSKQFITKTVLTRHLRVHTGEKPYKCDICSKQFKDRRTVSNHLLIHDEDKPFKCDYCSKPFAGRSYLDTHLKAHTRERNFKCVICLKQFTTKTKLTNHLRIHTGEKPFKCKICFKVFVEKGHLRTHLKIHDEEKQFKCDICLRQFRYKHTWNNHLKTHSVTTI